MSVPSRALSFSLSLPLPGGTALLASIPSLTRPFSLTARWTPSISADRPFASSLSLARGPHPSAPSASLTSRPHTPPWMCPHCAFPGHLRMHPTSLLSPHPTHSLPLPSCAPNRTPSLSPALCVHPGSSVAPLRASLLVLWPSSSLFRAHCLGEFHLFVSSPEHPSVRPQHL
jgi:hypothetical protein